MWEEEDQLCEQVILRAYLKMLTSPNISLQEANWIFAAEKIWICSVSLTNFPLQMKICSKLIYRCKGFKEDCSLFSCIWYSGKCNRTVVRIIHSFMKNWKPKHPSSDAPLFNMTLFKWVVDIGNRFIARQMKTLKASSSDPLVQSLLIQSWLITIVSWNIMCEFF